MIALAGIILPTLLGYTLIVETIFRYEGLGYQLVQGIIKRDYALAQTLALVLTATVIFFNFLADIAHQLDRPARPRSRADRLMAAAREFAPRGRPSGLRRAERTRFRDALCLLLANKVGLMGGLLTLFVLCVAGRRLRWCSPRRARCTTCYVDQSCRDSRSRRASAATCSAPTTTGATSSGAPSSARASRC